MPFLSDTWTSCVLYNIPKWFSIKAVWAGGSVLGQLISVLTQFEVCLSLSWAYYYNSLLSFYRKPLACLTFISATEGMGKKMARIRLYLFEFWLLYLVVTQLCTSQWLFPRKVGVHLTAFRRQTCLRVFSFCATGKGEENKWLRMVPFNTALSKMVASSNLWLWNSKLLRLNTIQI